MLHSELGYGNDWRVFGARSEVTAPTTFCLLTRAAPERTENPEQDYFLTPG